MLRVKILGADGSYVTRDEIVSLYASDMDYVPYIRKASVDYDATVNLEVPQGPVILHAKLRVPGYGYGMWIMSDNCGEGYGPDAEGGFYPMMRRRAAFMRLRLCWERRNLIRRPSASPCCGMQKAS